FLSSFRRGIKREDSAVITTHPANSKTRFRILKILVSAFVKTLQAVDFAPRHLPVSKIVLKCVQDFVKRGENIQVLISQYTIMPETEDGHGNRIIRAAMIPARKFVVDFAEPSFFQRAR